jgi:hypothetical protein
MDDDKVDEKKAAVSAWMQAQGWPVTDSDYGPRLSMYLWRSHAVRPAITLFITRNVFDDHTAIDLVRILERLQTRQHLQRAPEKHTIIKGVMGEPVIEQIDEFPKDIIRSASQRSSVRLS